jgi:hypothetical protein
MAYNNVIRMKDAGGTNTIDGASLIYDLDQLRPDGHSATSPVAIQLLVSDAALAGDIEVANQDGTLDLSLDASWSPAEDLSTYATVGGAVVLVAPFTHIRLNVSAGDTEAIMRV